MINLHVDSLLADLLDVSAHVTGINLSVGRRAQVEVNGELVEAEAGAIRQPLTPFQLEVVALSLMGGERRLVQRLVRTGAVDLSYAIPGRTRLRVNIFRQRGTLAASLRVLADRVPDLAELGLPPEVEGMASLQRGLVLVAGPAGAGKSTTLAAMVDRVNATRACHIVCIEDPIEYLFQHQKATVNQREVGADTPSLHQAFAAAMRQGAKVILMTELHELESLKVALWAAETGHLVLAALPADDIATAVAQVSAGFPEGQQRRLWARVAQAVQMIVGQRLVPRIGGGFVAVAEVIASNEEVRQLLAFYGHVDGQGDAYRPGLDLDRRLLEVVRDGLVSRDAALVHAVDPDALAAALAGGTDVGPA